MIENLVEVTFDADDNFLKIKETLTRIGVPSKQDNILYQSCHILHKKGKYYIVHFKELFLLDGKESSLDETDIGRRNTITNLLEQWGLLKVVDKEKVKSPLTPISQIKIISYKEKNNWELITKYNIGKTKKV